MQVAFVALDSAPYRIGVAVSQWQKHDLFHLINPIGVVDTYDTPNASVSVFSAMSADALKMNYESNYNFFKGMCLYAFSLQLRHLGMHKTITKERLV